MFDQVEILYLSSITLGVLAGMILLLVLKQSNKRLPENWRSAPGIKRLQTGILYITIYLLIELLFEITAIILANNYIYNSFMMNYNNTFSIPFLFGFFFINTQTTWKRIGYIVLYASLVIFFLSGGFYHPKVVNGPAVAVVIFGITFMAALLQLTELLVNPKVEHFSFQLKIAVCVLIFDLLPCIMTTFIWSDFWEENKIPDLFYNVHFAIIISFHILMGLIFIYEIFKLRSSTVLHD